MGSTKIINILKNDAFEEVFDLFKNTEAEEVIFILPKGSRFARQSGHFEAIGLEAERSNRKVSVMTSDPSAIKLASQNNFGVLNSPKRTQRSQPRTIVSESAEQVPVDFSKENPEIPSVNSYYENGIPSGDGEIAKVELASKDSEDGDMADIALAVSRKTPEAPEGFYERPIKDIVHAEYQKDVEVKSEQTRTLPLEIKSSPLEDSGRQSDIARIWSDRERVQRNQPTQVAGKGGGWKIIKKMPAILLVLAIAVLGLILYLTLGNAKIIIYPQKKELGFMMKVTASVAESSVNIELNRIPGQKFSEQKEESVSLSTTGNKEVAQKASGTITIFNTTKTDQRLVATTRFRSPDGLIFRIPQTINVPADSSVESVVFADRPGEEYNIGPARFDIPGFEGSPKFNEFYATSDTRMTGGLIGPASVVTEEDFAKGEETINQELRSSIVGSFKKRAADLEIIDSAFIDMEIPIANAKVGEAATTLQITAKGTAEVIGFKRDDILKLIENYISQSEDLELVTDDLNLAYTDPQLSSDGKSMTFNVGVDGFAVSAIDVEKITEDVRGMSENSIRAYFMGINDIGSARIVLSPFWVKSVPKNPKKIEVIINID